MHQAITESKIISFQYGDVNIHKDFQLRHKGNHYQIKPYALVWESNFYYLIGDDIAYDKTKNSRHYPLARMRNVSITFEKFIKKSRDISSYVQHTFNISIAPLN
ncbi:WYL domain-containing protein [Alkalihalobacillus deserti]|uniref:WYL domain-containing protein n=1 Tax=Alkalihalobacillus deserti TaxID=2879466 RepID=UPI001D13B5C3